MAPRPLATHLLIWLVAICAAAHAAERDRDEPIRINARHVEVNEKTGVMVYRGQVEAVQGALSIRADRLEVRRRDGKTDRIHATGQPVLLDRRADAGNEALHAEAERVDYHVTSRRIDLSGNVTLRRGPDVFTAHVLHYEIDSQRLDAAGRENGDGRVHAVIHPASAPTAAPATP